MGKDISHYSYDAFISYTRRNTSDWKASRWIYRQLERFTVPGEYRKNDSDGKSLKRLRVFRDARDLPSGELKEKIDSNLRNSENLILVSSLEAGKAEWVEHEVSHFLSSHPKGSGTIMPLLVDGHLVPESFPESFNKVQQEREFLVVSLKPVINDNASADTRKLTIKDHNFGKKQCLHSILSALTGMKIRDIEKRLLRQKIGRILSYVGPLVLLCGLLLFYKMPRHEYYAAYNDRYGVPSGVMQLSKETVAHRMCSYRFEYRRIPIGEPGMLTWRLHMVEKTSRFSLMEGGSVHSLELVYAKGNGILAGTISRDANGAVVSRSVFTNDGDRLAAYEDFERPSEGQGISFQTVATASEEGFLKDEPVQTSISRRAYKRDENGFVTEVSYHSNNDYRLERSATCDEDGIWRVRYSRDGFGNVTDKYYLDRSGAPATTNSGLHHIHFTYDESGLESSMSYFDINDKPAMAERIHKKEVTRDRYGNITEESYYDVDGNSCIDDIWISKIAYSYDEAGHMVKQQYFDAEGKPCYRKGMGAATVFDYSDDGFVLTESHISPEGEPVTTVLGYHKLEKRYNRKGQEVFTFLYGLDGDMSETDFGYQTFYDRFGRISRQVFLGSDGKPMKSDKVFGCAAYDNEYDEKGNRVRQTLLDDSLQCARIEYGYAQTKFEYDGRGNNVRVSFLDEEGKPVNNTKDGAACIESDFDDYGHRIEIRFYDTDYKPTLNAEGYFKVTQSFDESGNMTEKAYYGTNERLANAPNDYYSVARAKFDSHRNVTEIAFFDFNGEPCYVKGDITGCMVRKKYNEKGLMTNETWFMADGMIGTGESLSYDRFGRIAEVLFVDGVGKPILGGPNGEACFTLEHDERGNLIRQVVYADAAKKCPTKEILMKYDERGMMLSLEATDHKTGLHTIVYQESIDWIEYGKYGEVAVVDGYFIHL